MSEAEVELICSEVRELREGFSRERQTLQAELRESSQVAATARSEMGASSRRCEELEAELRFARRREEVMAAEAFERGCEPEGAAALAELAERPEDLQVAVAALPAEGRRRLADLFAPDSAKMLADLVGRPEDLRLAVAALPAPGRQRLADLFSPEVSEMLLGPAPPPPPPHFGSQAAPAGESPAAARSAALAALQPAIEALQSELLAVQARAAEEEARAEEALRQERGLGRQLLDENVRLKEKATAEAAARMEALGPLEQRQRELSRHLEEARGQLSAQEAVTKQETQRANQAVLQLQQAAADQALEAERHEEELQRRGEQRQALGFMQAEHIQESRRCEEWQRAAAEAALLRQGASSEAQAGRLAAQLQEASAQMQQRLTAAEALGREESAAAQAACERLQRAEALAASEAEACQRLQLAVAEQQARQSADRHKAAEAELRARDAAEAAAKEVAERRRAVQEAEREAREAAALSARERQRAVEEADRAAREAAARRTQEEERLAQEEAVLRARVEAARLAKEAAERLAQEEAEARAREAAEQAAKEVADRRRALQEAERQAREEAELSARERQLVVEDADRAAREATARKRLEEERLAQEEAVLRAREEAARLAMEAAEHLSAWRGQGDEASLPPARGGLDLSESSPGRHDLAATARSAVTARSEASMVVSEAASRAPLVVSAADLGAWVGLDASRLDATVVLGASQLESQVEAPSEASSGASQRRGAVPLIVIHPAAAPAAPHPLLSSPPPSGAPAAASGDGPAATQAPQATAAAGPPSVPAAAAPEAPEAPVAPVAPEAPGSGPRGAAGEPTVESLLAGGQASARSGSPPCSPERAGSSAAEADERLALHEAPRATLPAPRSRSKGGDSLVYSTCSSRQVSKGAAEPPERENSEAMQSLPSKPLCAVAPLGAPVPPARSEVSEAMQSLPSKPFCALAPLDAPAPPARSEVSEGMMSLPSKVPSEVPITAEALGDLVSAERGAQGDASRRPTKASWASSEAAAAAAAATAPSEAYLTVMGLLGGPEPDRGRKGTNASLVESVAQPSKTSFVAADRPEGAAASEVFAALSEASGVTSPAPPSSPPSVTGLMAATPERSEACSSSAPSPAPHASPPRGAAPSDDSVAMQSLPCKAACAVPSLGPQAPPARSEVSEAMQSQAPSAVPSELPITAEALGRLVGGAGVPPTIAEGQRLRAPGEGDHGAGRLPAPVPAPVPPNGAGRLPSKEGTPAGTPAASASRRVEEPASSPTASLQGSEAQPTYRSNATEDVAVANMLATVLGPAFADLLPPAGAAAAASPQQRPLSAGAASARSTVGPLRRPVVGLGAAAASAAEDSAEEASVGPYAQLLDGGALQRALAAERAGSESLDTLGIEAAFGHGLGGASPKACASGASPSHSAGSRLGGASCDTEALGQMASVEEAARRIASAVWEGVPPGRAEEWPAQDVSVVHSDGVSSRANSNKDGSGRDPSTFDVTLLSEGAAGTSFAGWPTRRAPRAPQVETSALTSESLLASDPTLRTVSDATRSNSEVSFGAQPAGARTPRDGSLCASARGGASPKAASLAGAREAPCGLDSPAAAAPPEGA